MESRAARLSVKIQASSLHWSRDLVSVAGHVELGCVATQVDMRQRTRGESRYGGDGRPHDTCGKRRATLMRGWWEPGEIDGLNYKLFRRRVGLCA